MNTIMDHTLDKSVRFCECIWNTYKQTNQCYIATKSYYSIVVQDKFKREHKYSKSNLKQT